MTKDNKNNQIIIDFLTQKIKEPFEISNVNWNGSCFTLNIKINDKIKIESIYILDLINFAYLNKY